MVYKENLLGTPRTSRFFASPVLDKLATKMLSLNAFSSIYICVSPLPSSNMPPYIRAETEGGVHAKALELQHQLSLQLVLLNNRARKHTTAGQENNSGVAKGCVLKYGVKSPERLEITAPKTSR